MKCCEEWSIRCEKTFDVHQVVMPSPSEDQTILERYTHEEWCLVPSKETDQNEISIHLTL